MRTGLLRFGAAAVVAAAMPLLGCGQNTASPPPPPSAPAAPAVDPLTQQRMADLIAINNAVKAYYDTHGQYPVTSDRGSFVSIISAGDAWIPGLTPDFIASLPRDPGGSTDPNNQYWYASQGGSYKLIVHGVGAACGPEVEVDGIRRDPARSRADGSCWAYGFWTDNLSNY